jgi:hypothetical protein
MRAIDYLGAVRDDGTALLPRVRELAALATQ